jgi:hypothetical protein
VNVVQHHPERVAITGFEPVLHLHSSVVGSDAPQRIGVCVKSTPDTFECPNHDDVDLAAQVRATLAQYPAVAARLPGVTLVAIDVASYVVQAGPALVDGV